METIKTMKAFTTLAILVLLFCAGITTAQQLPDYTLYTNNLIQINSAYTGVPENFGFTMGYRKQWVGFEGAPSVMNFAGHGYLSKIKVGVGVNGWQFEAGAFKQTGLFSNYSYRLEFEDFNLNFGLNAGIINYRTNYAGADLNGISDPLFAQDINQTNFNTGGGVFLFADKYYAGFSAPVLMTYENNENAQVKMNQHFMLMGGYLFDLSEKWVVKPHALMKIIPESPVVYYLGANVYYKEHIGFGMIYKSQKTMAFTLDINFEKSFYLAYAYDLSGGADISAAQYGSHEISLTYLLPSKGNKNEKTRFY